MRTLKQIAHDLAVNMKAAHDDDAGNHWFDDEHGHLSEAEWRQVCDMAEELLPTVVVPRRVAELWAEARSSYRAECRAEQRAFSGGL